MGVERTHNPIIRPKDTACELRRTGGKKNTKFLTFLHHRQTYNMYPIKHTVYIVARNCRKQCKDNYTIRLTAKSKRCRTVNH